MVRIVSKQVYYHYNEVVFKNSFALEVIWAFCKDSFSFDIHCLVLFCALYLLDVADVYLERITV